MLSLEVAVTRVAVTTEADAEAKGDIRTMVRKYIIPYGLYRTHGWVSAPLGADAEKGSGFSEDGLALLWEALERMFGHDHSTARCEMTALRLVVFRHESPLGNAPAHRRFERARIKRVVDGETVGLGELRARELAPARAYSDYAVDVDVDGLMRHVAVVERI